MTDIEIAREVLVRRRAGEKTTNAVALTLGLHRSTISLFMRGKYVANGSKIAARVKAKWPEAWAEVTGALPIPKAAPPARGVKRRKPARAAHVALCVRIITKMLRPAIARQVRLHMKERKSCR